RNSIDRGSRDYWTPRPSRIAAVTNAAATDKALSEPSPVAESEDAPGTAGPRLPQKYFDMLQQPDSRDPRAYIVPADQPDFPTAVKFINALLKTGIAVHRTTADFVFGGKKYPANS